MRCVIGHIQHKRTFFLVCIDTVDGFFGYQFSRISFVVAGFPVVVPVQFTFTRQVEIIYRTVQMTIEVRKSPIHRIMHFLGMSQMPLTNNGSVLISVTCQHIGHRFFILIQSVLTPGRNNSRTDTKPVRVTSRHQSRTGRRTDGRSVKAFEFHSFAHQSIQTGSLDFTTMKPYISPTQIVGQYNHNIRTLCLRMKKCRKQSTSTKQTKKFFFHDIRFINYILCFIRFDCVTAYFLFPGMCSKARISVGCPSSPQSFIQRFNSLSKRLMVEACFASSARFFIQYGSFFTSYNSIAGRC